MGQKVHPIGFRLGVSKEWQAKWYADKAYTDLIQEDLRIRQAIQSKYGTDDISRIEIERSANQVTVTVYTARPGIVIGRGGQRVDEMRQQLERTAGKRVRLNILEVAQPELDAYLVARSIAQQMERRISHRRAMKQAISRAMERGAQGIKITCAGRLSGSEYARKETLHQGRVPLHTLRADIDYAQAEAHTTLGRTGVKVWIYKGDVISESERIFLEGGVLTPVEERDKVEQADSTEAAPPAEGAEASVEAAEAEVEAAGEAEVATAVSGDNIEEQKAPAEEAKDKGGATVAKAERPKGKAKAKAEPETATVAKAEKPKAKPKAKATAKSKEKDKAEDEAAEKPKSRTKAMTGEGETAVKAKAKTSQKAEKGAEDGTPDESGSKANQEGESGGS